MNNLLEYKGYCGTVEYSASDEVFFGKVIGLDGLISYEGKSVDTLKRDFEEAIDDYIEVCQSIGKEPQKTYKGKFNVRVNPEIHRRAVLYAAAHQSTLNKVVEEAIDRFVR